LEVEAPIEFIFAAKRLVQARPQRILMSAVENGHLVVIARITGNIWQWIKLQQGLRLRADGHDIARERQARCRIEYDDGLAERIEQACEIAHPFFCGGYAAGLSLSDVVARPLVGDEENGPVRQQMRDFNRSSER